MQNTEQMWYSESKQIKTKHKTNAQTQLSQAMKLERHVKENWLRKDGSKLESRTGWLFLSCVRGSAAQSYYWHMEVIVYWNWNHTCAMLGTVAQLCLTLCDPHPALGKLMVPQKQSTVGTMARVRTSLCGGSQKPWQVMSESLLHTRPRTGHRR